MASSLKIVTGGGLGYEGAFGNFYNGQGQGVWTPAGTHRTLTLDLHIPAGDTWRAAVNCFDATDSLLRATPLIVTGTGGWQTVTLDIPALTVDCSQQLSATGGSAGASLGSITVNVRNVTLTDATAVSGAPVFDAASTSKVASATSLTWSHTCTGTNRVLYVGLAFDSHTNTGSSVTYNGVAASLVKRQVNASAGTVELWRLTAPATGAHNIVATLTGTDAIVGGAISLTNVDQTTPERAAASGAIGSSQTASVSLSSAANDLVVAAAFIDPDGTNTATLASGAERWNSKQWTTFGAMGAGATVPGAATVTPTWSISFPHQWGIVACSVKGAATTAPANTVLPVISGTATQNSTLTGDDGTWTNSPTGFTYQWERETAAGSGDYQPLDTATQPNYTIGREDVGLRFKLTVTAQNAGGATSATSAAVGPVTAIVPAPVADVGPVASGSPFVGATVTVDNGFWENSPTSFTYQWASATDPAFTTGAADITGATGSSYTPQTADIGTYLRATVTATNSAGSATAVSSVVGPVLARAVELVGAIPI